MEALEAKSKDGIIMFNNAEVFKRLVISQGQPRPYDVVIFVNLPPKVAEDRELEHCIKSEQQFHQVVYSFHQHRKKKSETKERTIFLGIMYVDANDEGLMDIF